MVQGIDTPAGLLAEIPADDPRSRLARHVATIGGGAARARPLTMAEASEAFSIILDGAADPVQIGALLVAMQYRGITAEELAGMTMAARRACAPQPDSPSADLDWPAYLSPRNRRAPLFLMAARILAAAGYKVLLHGYAQGVPQFGPVLGMLDIPLASSREDAAHLLQHGGIAFLPLPDIDPQLQALVNLYRMFDMRSPVNMMLPLLDPTGAAATVLGTATAKSASLQIEAARLLGQRRVVCVENNRDVAQATPHRPMTLHLSGQSRSDVIRLDADPLRRLPKPPLGFATPEFCASLWERRLYDVDAEAMVTDTVALGLLALDAEGASFEALRETACHLWEKHRGFSDDRLC